MVNVEKWGTTLEELLETLLRAEIEHKAAGRAVWEAYDQVYFPDILVFTVLKRSMALHSGFRAMLLAENFACAAPLVRLELDTSLRMFAALLFGNVDNFVMRLAEGQHIRRMKDQTGRLMTDQYLVQRLAEHYPEAPSIYDRYSGDVHLSESHLRQAFRLSGDGPDIFEMYITASDPFVTEAAKIEAARDFLFAAQVLFNIVADWVTQKRSYRNRNRSGDDTEA
ncbi:MAG: hypothetical protein IPJ58_19130 [Ardenticatenia bacterium]|nr:hypothetical protein [Ardenticatenia bacterium]